jgi:chromosome segregation ATPase
MERITHRKDIRTWTIIIAVVSVLFLVTCITFLFNMNYMKGQDMLSEDDENKMVDKKFQIWEKKMYLHSSAIKLMREELVVNKKKLESDFRRLSNLETNVKETATENTLSDISNKIESKLDTLKSEVNSLRVEVNHKYSDGALDRLNQEIERTANKEAELESTANGLKDLVIQLQQQLTELKRRLDERKK